MDTSDQVKVAICFYMLVLHSCTGPIGLNGSKQHQPLGWRVGPRRSTCPVAWFHSNIHESHSPYFRGPTKQLGSDRPKRRCKESEAWLQWSSSRIACRQRGRKSGGWRDLLTPLPSFDRISTSHPPPCSACPLLLRSSVTHSPMHFNLLSLLICSNRSILINSRSVKL
jgi:hypothetical protein